MPEAPLRAHEPNGSERQMAQDRSLMERLHDGDPGALDELIDRFWHPLVAYATRLLTDPDDAEDVVQETMLRVWRERARWTPSDRLRGFLYQITRNLALNLQDKKRVRRTWAEAAGRESPPSVPTPHQLAERSELQALLDRVVEELPPKRREVFILARYHGHTYQEISDVMDISPQTVANQMSAALDDLRTRLRPQLDTFLSGGHLRLIEDTDSRSDR